MGCGTEDSAADRTYDLMTVRKMYLAVSGGVLPLISRLVFIVADVFGRVGWFPGPGTRNFHSRDSDTPQFTPLAIIELKSPGIVQGLLSILGLPPAPYFFPCHELTLPRIVWSMSRAGLSF